MRAAREDGGHLRAREDYDPSYDGVAFSGQPTEAVPYLFFPLCGNPRSHTHTQTRGSRRPRGPAVGGVVLPHGHGFHLSSSYYGFCAQTKTR